MRPKAITVSAITVLISIVISSFVYADEQNKRVTTPSESQFAITNATIIDGTGKKVQTVSTLVVSNDLIADIFPSSQNSQRLPTDIEVVDGSTLYVLPGLIDSHVHLATVPDKAWAKALLVRYLYGGITSVRDMAGDARALADLSRAALIDEIPAPDIHYSALVAGPVFFNDPRTISSAMGLTPGKVPWLQVIDDNTDMARAAMIAKGTHATGVKIYASVSANNIARITQQAHQQGMKVWAHGAVFPARPSEVVSAGVDTLSHICMLAWELEKDVPTVYQKKRKPDYQATLSGDSVNPVISDLLRQISKKDIIIDPNIRLYKEMQTNRKAATGNKKASPSCPLNVAARLIHAAYQAGVKLSTGTDGATDMAKNHYPALLEEMELLANTAGIPPLQVIKSATQIGAMALGIDNTHGTLEPGKKANLLVVSKNPLEKMKNLRAIEFVVKNGKRYLRSDFQLRSVKDPMAM